MPTPSPDSDLRVKLFPRRFVSAHSRSGSFVAADPVATVHIGPSWNEAYRAAALHAREHRVRVRIWWMGGGAVSLLVEISPAPALAEQVAPASEASAG